MFPSFNGTYVLNTYNPSTQETEAGGYLEANLVYLVNSRNPGLERPYLSPLYTAYTILCIISNSYEIIGYVC